jgi:Fic family protein
MINLEAYSTLPIIEQVNFLHQQIESLRPISSEQEQRILQKYRLDWNYHSNAIEGNSLTYGETRAFLMHGLTAKGKPLKDHLDIRGHNEAINFLYQMIKEENEITESDIRSLHKIILVEPYEVDTQTNEGIPAKKRIQIGVYKTSANHVLTQTGEIHYYATPEETPILMGELMETYRQNKSNPKVHPFILAAYFHYRLTAIHPFDDGNGRMARLMMNLLLMKAGFPPVIIRQEKASREAYYYALSQADAGEYLPFFELIGETLVHSMELYVKGAKGESLEEPDDLDKELAWLKREMETKESRIEVVHDIESQLAVYDQSISPFATTLDSIFTKFKDLFLEYTIGLTLPNPSNGSYLITKTIDRSYFQDHLRTEFRYVHRFVCYKDKENPFGVTWFIDVSFNNFDYKIFIDKKYYILDSKEPKQETLKKFSPADFFDSPVLITKNYHQYLSQNEILTYSNQIGQSFIRGIKLLHSKYEEIVSFDKSN